MMKKLLIGAFLGLPILMIGQETVKVEKRYLTQHWVTKPSDFQDDFQVSVVNLEAPFPGGEAAKNLIRQRKLESAQMFPRKSVAARGGEREASDSLVQLNNFPVRFFLNDAPLLGGTPNDNTLAISNSGKLLTSFNTQIWGYDMEQDSFLFRYPTKHPNFNQFAGTYTDSDFSLYFPFDPKLLYHPGLDRFVFVFLTGRDPSNSGAIISFSSSGNPSDDWYSYYLSGNPLDDNTWTDYPQIAMNDHSLYLTLNQLYPDSSWITGFSQTVIWQMDLEDGFSGNDTLTTKLWAGANYEGSKLRYLRPAKNGMGPEGDDMYFVANRPFDVQNDSIFLVRIQGDVNAEDTVIKVDAVKSNLSYGLPPDAIQPNGHVFLTNDARALGAVRMQDEIQFVGNTIDPASGKCAIYHGIIEDVNNPSVKADIITHDVRDLGYPNIDFMGKYRGDRDVLIFFNHTAATDPSGNSAIFFNSNRTYGPMKTLKEGSTYVDLITGNDERWGDYSGIQRKYNEQNKAWVAGYYSYDNKKAGIWVSEISTPPTEAEGVKEAVKAKEVKTYPNPTSDFVSVQFNLDSKRKVKIELLDMNGKLIRVFADDVVKSGLNQLSFSLLPLQSGIYFVRISDENSIILNEKIIKD